MPPDATADQGPSAAPAPPSAPSADAPRPAKLPRTGTGPKVWRPDVAPTPVAGASQAEITARLKEAEAREAELTFELARRRRDDQIAREKKRLEEEAAEVARQAETRDKRG